MLNAAALSVICFRRGFMQGKRGVALALSLAALALVALAFAFGVRTRGPRSPAGEVAATLGGRAITLSELDGRVAEGDPAGWAEIRQRTYEARRNALDTMIGDYVIDAEARRRGISREQLLEAELATRIHPVTGEEIASFYASLGERAGGASLEQLTPAIRQSLEEQRPIQARRALLDDLRRASPDVRVRLEPPRVEVTTAATDPVKGPPTAPVEIVEFSDFQCPFCARVQPTLKQLLARYGDRVRLVFKDFPLAGHPDAFPAAGAAQCAREQGKFWEYHDVLFANQHALGREDLKRYAAGLKLDGPAFSACLDEERDKYLVQADVDESQRYGVNSTPTFFINGRLLTGAQPAQAFEQIIDEELVVGAAGAAAAVR
jgi:protein-disulfide isomerase